MDYRRDRCYALAKICRILKAAARKRECKGSVGKGERLFPSDKPRPLFGCVGFHGGPARDLRSDSDRSYDEGREIGSCLSTPFWLILAVSAL